jgi:exodeoxyribonuclease-5
LAPNRAEDLATPVLLEEKKAILMSDVDGAQLDGIDLKAVLGSRERGLIIHKLIEEVLTGETEETMPALTSRAGVLVQAMGRPVADDPALGLAPAELAGCVVRVFELPEIVALRPCLKPEFPVYASTAAGTQELVTAGVVDAIAFGPEGAPTVIVDWKSDVDPSAETIEHYRAQVRAYLDMTEAERGLVVLATRGVVIPVSRSGPYQ